MSSFKIATPEKIENYSPGKIEIPQSHEMRQFLETERDMRPDFFELNPEVSHHIGLSDARSKEDKRKFDAEVLRYVQKIKDDAYQEAYEQGLAKGIEEAKKESFENAKQEIAFGLRTFSDLCEKINNISKVIYEQNEKDIIEISYLMAEKVVQRQIQKEPDLFVSVFKEVLKNQMISQIQISTADYEYYEKNKEKIGLDIDLSAIKVEANKDLAQGDILFLNEMGILDGTIQSRFDVLKQIVTGLES